MGVSWAFVVLLVYPALQVPMLWVIVRYCGLRNDDGPRNPVGYAARVRDDDGGNGPAGAAIGHCPNCGLENEPIAGYCRSCLAALSSDSH